MLLQNCKIIFSRSVWPKLEFVCTNCIEFNQAHYGRVPFSWNSIWSVICMSLSHFIIDAYFICIVWSGGREIHCPNKVRCFLTHFHGKQIHDNWIRVLPCASHLLNTRQPKCFNVCHRRLQLNAVRVNVFTWGPIRCTSFEYFMNRELSLISTDHEKCRTNFTHTVIVAKTSSQWYGTGYSVLSRHAKQVQLPV